MKFWPLLHYWWVNIRAVFVFVSVGWSRLMVQILTGKNLYTFIDINLNYLNATNKLTFWHVGVWLFLYQGNRKPFTYLILCVSQYGQYFSIDSDAFSGLWKSKLSENRCFQCLDMFLKILIVFLHTGENLKKVSWNFFKWWYIIILGGIVEISICWQQITMFTFFLQNNWYNNF